MFTKASKNNEKWTFLLWLSLGGETIFRHYGDWYLQILFPRTREIHLGKIYFLDPQRIRRLQKLMHVWEVEYKLKPSLVSWRNNLVVAWLPRYYHYHSCEGPKANTLIYVKRVYNVHARHTSSGIMWTRHIRVHQCLTKFLHQSTVKCLNESWFPVHILFTKF